MDQQQHAPFEQTAEQKQYKLTKSAFRATIRDLVIKQKAAKHQRKTVKLSFPRVLEPSLAQSTVEVQRYELRHLYFAYNVFRRDQGGAALPVPENWFVPAHDGKSKWGINIDQILQILKKYGVQTVRYSAG